MAFGPGLDELDDPRFDDAGRVHDWRNHVPEYVKEMWAQLDTEAKRAAYLDAEVLADAEEWD